MAFDLMNYSNNFDFLRLAFAIFVIITHSYALTGVSEDNDLLHIVTNGSLRFSTLGVNGFFIISGFLIMESLKRSQSLSDYYAKRVLRIFPGLVVVLLVTLLVGLFVSPRASVAYDYLTYFLHNVGLVKLKHDIKGVFENNPYPDVVNGSLWTIQYEFLFYILLSVLFIFRSNKRVSTLLLLSAYCVTYTVFLLYIGKNFYYFHSLTIPNTTFSLWALSHFGLYFSAGAILSALEINNFKYKKQLLLVTLIITIPTMAAGLFINKATYLLLPLLVILSGLQAVKGISSIKEKTRGDLSYGIYLYGFLIQQTLMHFFQLTSLELMIITIIIALVCGYLSWNFIEKYPLKLKEKIFQRHTMEAVKYGVKS